MFSIDAFVIIEGGVYVCQTKEGIVPRQFNCLRDLECLASVYMVFCQFNMNTFENI